MLTVTMRHATIAVMRDIREDLQDRLNAVETEYARLQKRISDLEGQKQMLSALLQEERRRWSDSTGEEPSNGHRPLELSDLIRDIMSDGTSWLGKGIASIAMQRGYQFGKSKPARVVHSTLIGMQHRLEVQSLGSGRWKLAPKTNGLSEGAGD